MLRAQILRFSRSKFGIQGEINAVRGFFPVSKIRSVSTRAFLIYRSLHYRVL